MNLHAFPQKFQKKLHFLIQVFKKSNLGQIILIQAFIFSLGILGQNKQVSNNSKFYIRYTFLISFGNLNGIRKGKKLKIRTLVINNSYLLYKQCYVRITHQRKVWPMRPQAEWANFLVWVIPRNTTCAVQHFIQHLLVNSNTS